MYFNCYLLLPQCIFQFKKVICGKILLFTTKAEKEIVEKRIELMQEVKRNSLKASIKNILLRNKFVIILKDLPKWLKKHNLMVKYGCGRSETVVVSGGHCYDLVRIFHNSQIKLVICTNKKSFHGYNIIDFVQKLF